MYMQHEHGHGKDIDIDYYLDRQGQRTFLFSYIFAEKVVKVSKS